jgi:hypothetical protein
MDDLVIFGVAALSGLIAWMWFTVWSPSSDDDPHHRL